MSILIVTVGLPRSGKTTWAKKQGFPIVSPDAIRLAIHGNRFIKTTEPLVWTLARYMTLSLFEAGHAIVIFDATNTTKKRRFELTTWSDNFSLRFKLFDTSESECIRRAQKEHDKEIIPIIKSMAFNYEPLEDEPRWRS